MNLDRDPAVGHKSCGDHLVFSAKNLKVYNLEGSGSDREINDYNAYEEGIFWSPWKGRTVSRGSIWKQRRIKIVPAPEGVKLRSLGTRNSSLTKAAVPSAEVIMYQNCCVACTLTE